MAQKRKQKFASKKYKLLKKQQKKLPRKIQSTDIKFEKNIEFIRKSSEFNLQLNVFGSSAREYEKAIFWLCFVGV